MFTAFLTGAAAATAFSAFVEGATAAATVYAIGKGIKNKIDE